MSGITTYSSWFVEKINKVDKLLARLNQKEKKKDPNDKITSETGEITTNTTEIQTI